MKRIKSYLFILVILFNYPVDSFGQNDTIRLNNFCELALKYSEVNRDSAIYYADIAFSIAEKLHQKFYQASILSDLGYTLLSNGDYGTALTKLLVANKLIEDKNIAKDIIITPFFSKYFTSNDPTINRIILLGYIKNSLAMLYGRTENFDKQLSELKEAKTIIETETTDLNLSYTINNNIANAYINMGKLDSALFFQQIVLSIESKIENKNYGGASNKAIGDILFRKGYFDNAKINYLTALKLLEKNKNTFYIALTQFALADTYRKLGKVDSALYYSKAGIANYRSLGSYVPEMEEAYTALALSFKDENKYDSAFYYLQLSKKLSDSINDKEIKTLTNFQNVGFREQMRLKEAEAERIKTKNRTQVLLLLTGLLLFSIIAFILYKSNKMKVKTNLALKDKNDEIEKTVAELKTTQVSLAARNAENELLLKEIHHRVKNNLEVVSSLLALQSAQIDDPSVQSAMLASQNRVHSMGIIHQKLYQGENLAAIEMRDYFIHLSDNILDSFNAEGHIKVECDMPKLILDVDTAISVGLITNELLTNSLKYAFNEKENGAIKISLTEQDPTGNNEGAYLLKISDDGIGKPINEKTTGTGFGTQLVNLLTKQLDGKLTYEINNGTIVSLIFKKPKSVRA
ncbi:histidine kinase dimerization/phosphoacceptor domain -containing protein [Ferruginibacter paludis]|uniref:histidine kinase dimerization/phosphoacceptor domain -containing protein n=1 Tax=Ferruginibacter paludis TaxID=1310417 RepID=UPI0025B553C4|nr:histidine kinase dimerization/phosphoacceptor domain -containing protein [Ferruginibacter paludis]MDN3657279.1 histidine kinase dimerization/phosphoacceptor domain -containing protein [Ferruginibacter paludis]